MLPLDTSECGKAKPNGYCARYRLFTIGRWSRWIGLQAHGVNVVTREIRKYRTPPHLAFAPVEYLLGYFFRPRSPEISKWILRNLKRHSPLSFTSRSS